MMTENKYVMTQLLKDPRFEEALNLFNSCEWYLAHDKFEELWHESYGGERIALQAVLQIAVAQVHLQNGNINGATILYGEGLGRLREKEISDLGLDLEALSICVEYRLKQLHSNKLPDSSNLPFLKKNINS